MAEKVKLFFKKNLKVIIPLIFLFIILFSVLLIVISKDKKQDSDKENTESHTNVKFNENDIFKVIEELQFFDFLGKDIIKIDNLSNQDILKFARDNITNKSDESYKETISLEEMENVVKKYLDVLFSPENIECNFVEYFNNLSEFEKFDYIYNEDKKIFEPNNKHPYHGNMINKVFNKIKSIDVENNVYIVKVYKIFENVRDAGPATSYYSSLEDASNGVNSIATGDNIDVNEIFDDESKLQIYTYSFVKNDNSNFLLNSYIINKR